MAAAFGGVDKFVIPDIDADVRIRAVLSVVKQQISGTKFFDAHESADPAEFMAGTRQLNSH